MCCRLCSFVFFCIGACRFICRRQQLKRQSWIEQVYSSTPPPTQTLWVPYLLPNNTISLVRYKSAKAISSDMLFREDRIDRFALDRIFEAWKSTSCLIHVKSNSLICNLQWKVQYHGVLYDLCHLSLSDFLPLSLPCRRDETRTRVQELGGQKAISSDMCVHPLIHSPVASFTIFFRVCLPCFS